MDQPTIKVEDGVVTREQIVSFEDTMRSMPEHFVEPVMRHHFAPGLYAREMLIRAGETYTGKIHLTRNIAVMGYGDLMLATPGKPPVRLTGYNVLITEPGEKRAVHALQDTLFTCFLPTNETDLEKIEEAFVAETFAEYEARINAQISSERNPPCPCGR